MQLTSKHFTCARGFTLVEMAIVLVIIGIIASATLSIYRQYKAEEDFNRTNDNIEKVMSEIRAFYQTYGRYPCPASATAAPGDALYGVEKTDCIPNPVGDCTDGVCTVASLNAPQTIMIGSIPFKKLNLQDRETYDAYLSRFTYAVTSSLTDADEFNPVNGGISVGDGNTPYVSMVEPANTAHFVLISHGRDKSGAISRSGALSGACGGIDAENCDGDELFTSREVDSDFDDLIHFHTQFAPTEWKSDESNTSIGLKTKDKMLINAKSSDGAAGFEDDDVVIVRKQTTDVDDGEGEIYVDNRVYTENLCEEDNDNCFNPRLIAGNLTPENPLDPSSLLYEDGSGNGISCYVPGNNMEYLTGIGNNMAECTDQIVLECPDGQFITSVVNGRIRCNAIIQDCAETNLTTFCGDNFTLPLSPPSTVISEYSGECQYITDYDSAYFAAQTAGLTMNQARTTIINPINNEARDIQNCDSDRYSSQVRDTYVCNDGQWDTLTPHEKRYPWYNFPSNVYASDSTNRAENSYGGTDNNNNNGYHDCWCREDYRVEQRSCPDGSNNAYRVQKHTCPQTSHSWSTIYTNVDNCTCAPTTNIETMSCNAYYNQVNGSANNPNNGLTGTVYLTYDVTCAGNTPVQSTNPISTDTSECACASGNTSESRTACSPNYHTNSWTNMFGGNENNVSQISRTPWVCPGTSTNGLVDPAFRDNANTTIELATDPCACAGGTVSEFKYCENGLNGKIYFEAPIDCATGDAVTDESLWTETSRDCRECRWESSASPSIKSVGLGVVKGGTCDCGSPAEEVCYQGPIGINKYNTWTGCQCSEQ